MLELKLNHVSERGPLEIDWSDAHNEPEKKILEPQN